jgi:hypothetical protein
MVARPIPGRLAASVKPERPAPDRVTVTVISRFVPA